MKAHGTGAGKWERESLLALAAILIGLGYVLVIPFFGLLTLGSLLVYRIRKSIAIRRYGRNYLPTDTWLYLRIY